MSRVLALDPYATGSHRAVLAGWRHHSRHRFVCHELPGHHWKWRMRHGAWTLARACDDQIEPPAAVWCTDMLDLASWRGLVRHDLARLPTVLYLHENQLGYPDQRGGERDLHFAFTNLLSAAAADAVWWNSAWHRDDFLARAGDWLRRLPDHRPLDALERIAERSRVLYPGIDPPPSAAPQARPADGPCHLLWAARWEADKGPGLLTAALDGLLAGPDDWCISIIGGDTDQPPPAFADLPRRLGSRLRHWGWQAERAAYHAVLQQADVIVSTAQHEFFGLAVLEAVAAGAQAIVPDHLAYPEVLAASITAGETHTYAPGDADALRQRLRQCCDQRRAGPLPHATAPTIRQAYAWPDRAQAWDAAMDELIGSTEPREP